MWRSRTRIYCPNCSERYAPGDRACGRCGRIRDQKTLAEMAAEANAWQRYLVWLWPTMAIGVLLLIALLVVKSQPVPTPHRVVTPPPPSAEERARIAKQKANDAKFWAAKERREAREVESYYTTLQVPPLGGTTAGAPPALDNTASGSQDIPSRAVLGAGVEMRPVSHSNGEGGEPSRNPQGTRGVSL